MMRENKNIIINDFGSDMKKVKEVKKYLSKKRKCGYFRGEKKIKIYYEKYMVKDEKARIVICHGFSENLEKYEELIYYFMEMGYSVYAVEHRGHGRSGHLGTADKSQVNIDDFNYYVEDLKTFLDKYVFDNKSKVYLFAHSMGGGIAALFLIKYPQYFKKAVLSSPMLEINTGKLSNRMARIISKIYIAMGKGDEYIFGQSAFDGKYDLEHAGTCNRYRYENHLADLKAHKELQRSGGSFFWINKSLKATKEIFRGNKIENIDIPILMFQSGADTFVKSEGQDEFCKRCTHCKKVKFAKAKHELYFENDDILVPYLKEIKDFFD